MSNLSLPVGYPVRGSLPTPLSATASALLIENVPCHGDYCHDLPFCRQECVVRDSCRVKLGVFAALQASSLGISAPSPDAASPPPPVVTGPSKWRRAHNRSPNLRCTVCGDLIEVSVDCWVLRDERSVVRHLQCEPRTP